MKFIPSFVLILLVLVSILSSWNAFTEAPVASDSGYYLSIAERIAEGWIPYKDIYSEYPPVAMYFYSIPAWLGSHNYTNFYLINYLFLTGISGLMYCLSFQFIRRKILSLIAGFITLILLLYFQGYNALLEPFVVFFYLGGIYFFLTGEKTENKWKLLLSGVFFFLSFFSKQYGLLVLPAVFVYVLLSAKKPKQKIKIYAWMFSGFALSSCIALSYFYFNTVSPADLLLALSGKGNNATISAYGNKSFTEMFKAILFYILRAEAFLIALPLLLIINPGIRKDRNFIFLLLLNLFAFIPLYIVTFTHYFQLIVPFSVLLGVFIFNYCSTEEGISNKLFKGFIIFSLLISTFLVIKINLMYDLIAYENRSRKYQLNAADQLTKMVPPKSSVYMVGAEEMYFLCNYLPADPVSTGYMFSGWFTQEQIKDICSSGEFLIIKNSNAEMYGSIPSQFNKVGKTQDVYVFQKR